MQTLNSRQIVQSLIVYNLSKIKQCSCSTEDTIFVADLTNLKIWKAPLDTLEFTPLPLRDITGPAAVDYDPVEHKLYWSDIARGTINRAKLDGSEQEVVLEGLGGTYT